jgi:hypothetical protein
MPRRVLLVSGEPLFAGLALWTFGRFREKVWLYPLWPVGAPRLRSRALAGVVPPISAESVQDAVVAAARHVGATHIVPDDVPMFAAVAAAVDAVAPVTTFPSNNAAQLLAFDDKATFTSTALRLGLPVIESKVAHDAASAADHVFSFPVMVKPATGSGSVGNRVCAGPAAFDAMLAKWPTRPQIIQPFVAGTDAHLTFLADHGELIAWEMHEPYPSDRPVEGVVRCFHDEHLLDIARRFATGTCFHGIGNMDFRRAADTGTPYLLECNPRLYGALDFATQAGVNFLQLGLDLGDGRRPARPVVARAGLFYRMGALPALLRRRPADVLRMATIRAAAGALADPKLAIDVRRSRRVRSGTRAGPGG